MSFNSLVDRVARQHIAKAITFAEAKDAILSALEKHRWKVQSRLKIPHATSPDGEYRLWFKPQAVYLTIDKTPKPRHDFGSARSIGADTKALAAMTPEAAVKALEKDIEYFDSRD